VISVHSRQGRPGIIRRSRELCGQHLYVEAIAMF
jgi:hypothetical protein